jgi:hypothetical protein
MQAAVGVLEDPNLSTLSQIAEAGAPLKASTNNRRCAPFRKMLYGTARE